MCWETHWLRARHTKVVVISTLNTYSEVIKEFTTAIRLNPGYTSAYWARGWAYDSLNQYQQAIQDFDKAIQLDPYDRPLAMAYDGRRKG